MIKVNDDDVYVEGGILDVILDLARAITAVHKATEESTIRSLRTKPSFLRAG